MQTVPWLGSGYNDAVVTTPRAATSVTFGSARRIAVTGPSVIESVTCSEATHGEGGSMAALPVPNLNAVTPDRGNGRVTPTRRLAFVPTDVEACTEWREEPPHTLANEHARQPTVLRAD